MEMDDNKIIDIVAERLAMRTATSDKEVAFLIAENESLKEHIKLVEQENEVLREELKTFRGEDEDEKAKK